MKLSRILKLSSAILVIAIAASSCALIDTVGGAYDNEPENIDQLSPGAQALMAKAYEGIDQNRLLDHHTHIVGVNSNGSGTMVNPKLLSWAHPIHRLKTSVYLSGANVTDLEKGDEQYLDRMLRLIRNAPKPSKHLILAFDHYYNANGSKDLEKSEFYTPNEYVFKLATEHPDAFVPAISVHPYRPDALQELEKWAKRGARYIKWLPNAMGMKADDPKLDSYYDMVKKYGMVILTHVGEEQAVEAEEDQKLGNPLLFRYPLDRGVKLIMAHCGSLGENADLDNDGKTMVSSHDLFLRLLSEPKYDGLLFGDISAMTQFNRLPGPMNSILSNESIQHKLVNGSDYPLPSINIVIRTGHFVKYGYITEEERGYLNEIYDYNPLIFDFVSKRTIRHPDTGKGLPASVFMQNPALPVTRIR